MTAEGRYSRNEGPFGAEGQAKIAGTKVTIVGLGGLGSHVAQQLAYLGIRMFALVDFDIVTESSMNRLSGASYADVSATTKKIDAAERMIHSISPAASVDRFDSTGLSSPKSAPGITRFASTWTVTPEAARASGMEEGSCCARAAGAWCA